MGKNPNKNCLEGMRCPKCGSYDAFNILITTQMRFTDEGEDFLNDKGSAQEWDDDSWCRCCECDWDGKVKDFKEKEDGRQEDDSGETSDHDGGPEEAA